MAHHQSLIHHYSIFDWSEAFLSPGKQMQSDIYITTKTYFQLIARIMRAIMKIIHIGPPFTTPPKWFTWSKTCNALHVLWWWINIFYSLIRPIWGLSTYMCDGDESSYPSICLINTSFGLQVLILKSNVSIDLSEMMMFWFGAIMQWILQINATYMYLMISKEFSRNVWFTQWHIYPHVQHVSVHSS